MYYSRLKQVCFYDSPPDIIVLQPKVHPNIPLAATWKSVRSGNNKKKAFASSPWLHLAHISAKVALFTCIAPSVPQHCTAADTCKHREGITDLYLNCNIQGEPKVHSGGALFSSKLSSSLDGLFLVVFVVLFSLLPKSVVSSQFFFVGWVPFLTREPASISLGVVFVVVAAATSDEVVLFCWTFICIWEHVSGSETSCYFTDVCMTWTVIIHCG